MLAALSLAFVMTRSPGLRTVASAEIAEAVEWLPADTETVTVAAVPGSIADFKEGQKLANAATSLLAPGLPFKGADTWNLSYEFIVDGSRNYRYPKGLGLQPYDGCKILALQEKELARIKARTLKSATRKGEVAGHTVYVLEGKSEEDLWTFYLCFDGRYLFCATQKPFLAEVLKRKAGTKEGRALPDSLPQWSHIESGAPFWAIRQFTDASRKMKAGLNMGDDQIQGYAMWLAKDQQRFNIVSFSDSADGFERAGIWKQFLTQEGLPHTLENKAVDAKTTLIALDAQATGAERPLFLVMAALGHGVFL